MSDILSLPEVQNHLASLIPISDLQVFQGLKFAQLEGAFIGRVFTVYKAAGQQGGEPNAPKVLTRLRVDDFCADAETGPAALIKDISTKERIWVDTTPTRLWEFPLFMQIPPNVTLRWTLRREGDEVKTMLLFGLVTRMANRSETYTDGATYCLTPRRMRDLYPDSITESY